MLLNIRSARYCIARTAPGTVCCLPHVMRYNLPERVESFARSAELLGEDMRRT